MNPSLALSSALARHGVHRSSSLLDNSSSNNSGGGGGGGGASSSWKKTIHAMTVHPSLPRVAHLEILTSGSTKKQRIVIQQYCHPMASAITNNTTKNNDIRLLSSIPLENLPFQINAFRQNSKSKSTRIHNHSRLTLESLGQLRTITFLDREALFWQTARRQYGTNTNDLWLDSMEGETVLCADSIKYFLLDGIISEDYHPNGGGIGYAGCLGLQFTNILVLIRFFSLSNKNNYQHQQNAENTFTVIGCFEGQRSHHHRLNTGATTTVGKNGSMSEIGGGERTDEKPTTTMKVAYTPTSAILPITNSIVVYGCSDGAIRFHNLVPSMLYNSSATTTEGMIPICSMMTEKLLLPKPNHRQSTIKSVRGPNGRYDPVVMILNIDPVYNPMNDYSRVGGGNDGDPTGSVSNDSTLVLHSRLMTICGSGVAYVWDVYLMIDRSSGALRDLNVLPPLFRLDGLGSLTASPRNPPETASQAGSAGDFWSRAVVAKSKDGATPAPYSIVTPTVSYDPHRNLLMWTLPSSAPTSSIDHRGDYGNFTSKQVDPDHDYVAKWSGDNGGFVKVWDLAIFDISNQPPSSSSRPPPKVPPIAIIKIPKTIFSAASPSSFVAGLLHTPISAGILSCVGFSQDRMNVLIYSAPLPHIIENTIMISEKTSVSPIQRKHKSLGADVEKSKILYINFQSCHTVPLTSDDRIWRGMEVSASFLSPDFIAVATDRGVVVVNIADGESWASKFMCSNDRTNSPPLGNIPSDYDNSRTQSIQSKISTGPIHTIISIGGVGNLPGIVFVEDHAVFSSRLRSTSHSKDGGQALVKRVHLNDPVMLCMLQGGEIPWRQLRSTSSSTVVESFRSMKCPPKLMPSPSGRYLCLFWDSTMTYEILHAGSLLAREQTNNPGSFSSGLTSTVDSGSNVSSFAWVGDDDHFALLRQYRDTFAPPYVTLDEEPNTISFANTKRRGRESVQLFKLAEVKVDAVELAAGASVAAATAVSLGSLTVRGSDHVVPNALFGGPTLCIGCLSTIERANRSDHVAYFYAPKVGAVETMDERASAYTAVGTSIPYPDLLTWDDNGKLCAVSYDTRVAIYLCDNSQFILLGSVKVWGSATSKPEASLVSMKFIHGVLYCSTQSSVHAIFFGNITDDNAVCELDEFTIATSVVPIYGVDNPDITAPIPAITSLKQPHILSYHSGGLLVSTRCGLRLLSLAHPKIRIGTLLAANLIDRARKWIATVPKAEHDSLAQFLIRRGHIDLVFYGELDGLSLENFIDLCMRYDRTDELVDLLDNHGSEILSEIRSWGRKDGAYSAFFLICMYMLGRRRIETTKKMIEIVLDLGINELLVDAMKLATFCGAADQPEGNPHLVQRVTDAMDLNSKGQFIQLNII